MAKTSYKLTSTVITFGDDCSRWVGSVCVEMPADKQAFLVHGFNSCVKQVLLADGGNLRLGTSGSGEKLTLNVNKADKFKIVATTPLEKQFALMVKLCEMNLEFGTALQMPILAGVRLEKRIK
jgi:hypothetical protein